MKKMLEFGKGLGDDIDVFKICVVVFCPGPAFRDMETCFSPPATVSLGRGTSFDVR